MVPRPVMRSHRKNFVRLASGSMNLIFEHARGYLGDGSAMLLVSVVPMQDTKLVRKPLV